MTCLSAYCLLPTVYLPLAFGFATWAFFWAGLAAVAIPVVIHLLNRRRYKTVTFAAMEFLLRAMKKNRRRLRFEQWALLATRCLLLVFLGMALARPLACENQSMAGVGGRTGLHVLVIDNSYSAAYEVNRADAKSHLDQAKKLAKSIIAKLSSGGESVAIVTTARPAAAAPGFDKPGYNLAAAAAAVDRVEQSFGSTDLAGAMQLAAKIGQDDARQAGRTLHLITDATRSAFEGGQADAIRQAATDLARTFHVTHYNLSGGRPQWNRAALSLAPSGNLVTKQFRADFTADVRGFGNAPEAPLSWSVNDTRHPDTAPIRLEANGAPQTLANQTFKAGGPQVVSVTVGGAAADALRADDTRYRVVDVASALKVLIVEGHRGVNPLEGSGSFLQVALAPQSRAAAAAPGPPKTDSYVAAELISDLELGNKVLDEYRAVVLAGVGQVPATQADALQKFVAAGGTLILFMGEPVNAENYNSVLLPRKLLPGTMVKRMQTAADQKGFALAFDPEGNVHPYLSAFKNIANTGLGTAQIFTYWQVDLARDAQVSRVLDYQPVGAATPGAPAAGDPAITVHGLGDGRVVFVSTSANADWTTLPAKPAYVTLMHEVLAGSVRQGDAWMNLLAGQPLEVPATVRLSATPTLLDPAKNPVALQPATDAQGRTIYRSTPLARPGVYNLSTGGATLPVAVNVAPDEADVRTLNDEAVKRALGDIDVTLRGEDLPAESAVAEAGNDLSWAFMLIVFALLAAECLMAMRFGHYRRTGARPPAAAA